MEFVALDVETANADMSSICQIGIACYNERLLVEEWKSYIDPEDYFDAINISIHGIDETTVKGSPKLSDVANQINEYLDNQVSVCHTHFDRVAIQQAFDNAGLRHPTCTWLDSACVARRTWEEFSRSGYGLSSVCEFLGYDFKHHDALEDAKAAAHIIHAAIDATGLDIDGWPQRVKGPICGPVPTSQDANPEGPLYGEVVVFTGALEIPRKQASDWAARAGCEVTSGVTKKTTILVVGDQDIQHLAGHNKSSKHRKAEGLIAKGQPIRILRETDFGELVKAACKATD